MLDECGLGAIFRGVLSCVLFVPCCGYDFLAVSMMGFILRGGLEKF